MVWMGLSLFNQSPPEEHLDCFQSGTTTNKVAKFEYKFLCEHELFIWINGQECNLWMAVASSI